MPLPRHPRRAALACALALAGSPAIADTIGRASFYGAESGRLTANGERFRPAGLTAASWTIPFGRHVRVTDVATGQAVVVRINDRGPARWTGRIIDLSHGAARALGILRRGVATVRVTVLD